MNVLAVEYYFIKESVDVEEVNQMLKKGYKLINTYVKFNQLGEGRIEEILCYVLGVDKEKYEHLAEVQKAERSPTGWQNEYKSEK